MFLSRASVLLPALWAGALLAVAALAAPAAFATLPQADAGRVVSRLLAGEAAMSLGLGMLLLMIERRRARDAAEAGQGSQFSVGMMLAAGALACTVIGYYAVLPQMTAARAGASVLSFGQWHAVSSVFYGLKLVLVLLLAWRASAGHR